MPIFENSGELTSSFSLDDFVIRRGKIFEAGDYPDKEFSITPEEMKEAVGEFTPVPVDLSHTSTVLDGKLGHLQAVEVSEDGAQLFGTVALPKWLDSLIEAGERKVSCTWDKATKRLRGIALTPTPRITDAVLMSAFSEYTHGQESDTTKLEKEMPTPETEIKETGESSSDLEARFAEVMNRMAEVERENEKLRNRQRRMDAERLTDELIDQHRAYPAERTALVAIFEQALIDDSADSKPSSLASFGQSKAQATRVVALKSLYLTRPAFDTLLEEGFEVEETEEGEIKVVKGKEKQEADFSNTPDPERIKRLKALTQLGQATLK